MPGDSVMMPYLWANDIAMKSSGNAISVMPPTLSGPPMLAGGRLTSAAGALIAHLLPWRVLHRGPVL
jgi:hypothetical protein